MPSSNRHSRSSSQMHGRTVDRGHREGRPDDPAAHWCDERDRHSRVIQHRKARRVETADVSSGIGRRQRHRCRSLSAHDWRGASRRPRSPRSRRFRRSIDIASSPHASPQWRQLTSGRGPDGGEVAGETRVAMAQTCRCRHGKKHAMPNVWRSLWPGRLECGLFQRLCGKPRIDAAGIAARSITVCARVRGTYFSVLRCSM